MGTLWRLIRGIKQGYCAIGHLFGPLRRYIGGCECLRDEGVMERMRGGMCWCYEGV